MPAGGARPGRLGASKFGAAGSDAADGTEPSSGADDPGGIWDDPASDSGPRAGQAQCAREAKRPRPRGGGRRSSPAPCLQPWQSMAGSDHMACGRRQNELSEPSGGVLHVHRLPMPQTSVANVIGPFLSHLIGPEHGFATLPYPQTWQNFARNFVAQTFTTCGWPWPAGQAQAGHRAERSRKTLKLSPPAQKHKMRGRRGGNHPRNPIRGDPKPAYKHCQTE